MDETEKLPPTVMLDAGAPAPEIKPRQLRQLATDLAKTFEQFERDRAEAERKWMRNLRQYLGIYDPEIESKLPSDRSRAYPRLTRVKCISMLSRIMNLMFPGNERNWQVKASPSPDMPPADVKAELQQIIERDAQEGVQTPVTEEVLEEAIENLAEKRAKKLSQLIDDQMQELGGDQTADYVRLNRKVAMSGIKYGIGHLHGPSLRGVERTRWTIQQGQPVPITETIYKPQYDFLPVWDVYLDMSAKSPEEGEGYFVRLVMSRSQLRKLGKREDFFEDMVKTAIKEYPRGNYKPKSFETELKDMGVNEPNRQASEETGKYEVLCWYGPLSAQKLQEAGVKVEDDKLQDDVSAVVWMVGSHVIKAEMNPWSTLGVDIRQLHTFVFDEDDTSPVGDGLPNVMRDSQMAICAASRMLLDNASVVCGPNIEVNVDLLEADTDTTAVTSHRVWERGGLGADANVPAVRNITIDSHMAELLQVVETFAGFADQETFVGPATGGDMERGYSEPMRTAAGASMMRGDAALPFKDIVRNYDAFTQSLIQSLVAFNKQFNPESAPPGDYNVIARGATSLIAKEIRGIQVDQLAATMSDQERVHVDERKLVEARYKVRDLDDLLVSADEARRRQKANSQRMERMEEEQREMMQAEMRKMLSDAFKNITQGNKNATNANVAEVQAVINALAKGVDMDAKERESIARVATQLQPPASSEPQR